MLAVSKKQNRHSNLYKRTENYAFNSVWELTRPRLGINHPRLIELEYHIRQQKSRVFVSDIVGNLKYLLKALVLGSMCNNSRT